MPFRPLPARRVVAGLLLGTGMFAALIAAAPRPPAAPRRHRPAPAATPAANPPVFFAQDHSDLVPDPAARFGRLPNGMTYVIYKNKTPPGAANIWMRVAAGSMMEQENQRGLAHFIEHMAFNGSKNVPEGEMVKLLERDGLQFGPDTNAQTSQEQTVYMLNMPDATDKIVDDVMFLMRETASNISFDPGAIDRERGVVLGEERASAGIGMRAYEAELKTIFPGQKYAERLPIGKVDVIANAKRDAFVQFYNDFYRPEYTTLVVAGDVDPDVIEAKIKRRFSDWRAGPRSPAALTRYGALRPRVAPEAAQFVGDGLSDTISVTWTEPCVDRIETRAEDYQDELLLIANRVLARRFARQAKRPETAFIVASFARQDVRRTARAYSLDIKPKEGQDRLAFAQAMATLRQFLAHGATPDEVDLILREHDSFYATRVAGERTRRTVGLSSLITNTVAAKDVLLSPRQGLAVYRSMRPRLTPNAVNHFIRDVNLSDAPVIWRQGATAAAFDRPQMLAAYRAAMAAPVPALAAPVPAMAARKNADWPYTAFGQPAAIVSREPMPDTGATRVVFANGVTLLVRPTDFEDDSIDVSVRFGNGYDGVAPDQAVALKALGRLGLFNAGLGKLDADGIQEALSGHIYSAGFAIGLTASSFSGFTTKADLPTQLRLLMAFATDAGFRPDALARMKARLPSAYTDLRTSPEGVYELKAAGNVYGDDPRYATPTERQLEAVDNDAVKALFMDQVTHGPVEIVIVGDVTVDEAVRQVGATFGTLPRLPTAASTPRPIVFPATDLHRVYTHDGRADQNLSVISWPTTDFYADPRRAVGLELLAEVMTLRELDEVRENQGASYSVSVTSGTSRHIPGFGYIQSRAMVRPEKDETYYRTVSAIAESLKAAPIGQDELDRARVPLIDRLRNETKTNGYWLGMLAGSTTTPAQIAAQRDRERMLMAVTPDDLQRLARTYLDMTKALRVQVKAKDGASAE